MSEARPEAGDGNYRCADVHDAAIIAAGKSARSGGGRALRGAEAELERNAGITATS